MPQMTKRKQEIISKAIKILANGGIEALSIRNIANQVGINDSSIYRHFQSKQDILKGAFNQFQQDAFNNFKIIDELDVSAFQKLKAYFYSICDWIQNDPDYLRLTLLEITYFKKVVPEDFSLLLKFIYDQISVWIEQAQENNEIERNLDKDYLVTIIRGTLLVILKHTYIWDDYDIKESCEKHWELIEKLISAK